MPGIYDSLAKTGTGTRKKYDSYLVVGGQWGDEGKGKIVDLLSEEAHLVVRFNGGPNAGHTVEFDGNKFILHAIPTGALRKGVKCALANGVVLDPLSFMKEFEELRKHGYEPDMIISPGAHVIMDYHKIMDGGKNTIGTTGRGIGPAYSDKASRYTAMRVGDFTGDGFPEKLMEILRLKEHELKKAGITKRHLFDLRRETIKGYAERLEEMYSPCREKIGELAGDVSGLTNEALDSGKRVIFEGAQGTLLDVDFGTYPYVTSSSTTAGGACTGTGVSPVKMNRVIMVVKAYTTRVGNGPLPTELKDETGERIRDTGGEFGATTGRPVALTKLDVLGGIDPLYICSSYRIDGKRTDRFPDSVKDAGRAEPVYGIEMRGWEPWDEKQKGRILEGGFDALPDEAKRYVDKLTKFTGDVGLISIGSKRQETIFI
jgi:adenylosuccinate synthase